MPESSPHSYTAVPDISATLRVGAKWKKMNRRNWLRYYFQMGCYFAIVGGSSSLMSLQIVGQGQNWRAGMLGAVVGAVVGVAWLMSTQESANQKQIKVLQDQKWVCQITEDAYTFTDRDGISKSIPWRLMKLEVEDPDAWGIKFGNEQIVIYRKPLKESGLDDEFMKHLLAGAT